MKTETIYYEEPYCRRFRGKVLSCRPKGKTWQVELDRTAFYPEGGGQPGDQGVLDTVNVLDTKEKDGIIFHETDRPLKEGSYVTGGINWPLRLSRMQEHTGEHIVSGIIHRLFGFNNVGFHMGSECVTLDLDGVLTQDQLHVVELMANDAVYQNKKVEITYPNEEELKKIDYRSKKELTGAVRIVTIPDYDVCACCGTHVSHTGEIGAIKLIGFLHYKGGIRISMLCGIRAMQDYEEKQNGVAAVSALLSAKPGEIAGAVERLKESETQLRQENAELRHQLLERKAETLVPENGVFCIFEKNLKGDDLRSFCLELKKKSRLSAVFSGENGRYQYALSSDDDSRVVGKALNAALHGRGGGKPELVQGSVQAEEEKIKAYFQKLSEK